MMKKRTSIPFEVVSFSILSSYVSLAVQQQQSGCVCRNPLMLLQKNRLTLCHLTEKSNLAIKTHSILVLSKILVKTQGFKVRLKLLIQRLAI